MRFIYLCISLPSSTHPLPQSTHTAAQRCLTTHRLHNWLQNTVICKPSEWTTLNHSWHWASTSQLNTYADTAIMCNSAQFTLFTHKWSLFSAPGLLAYEYIITFDHETKFFWKRSITGSSVLFMVNRYLPLIHAAMDIPFPDPTTTKVSILLLLPSVLTQHLFWGVSVCRQQWPKDDYSLEAASCEVAYYTLYSLERLQYLPWACEYMFYPQPHTLNDTHWHIYIYIVFSTLRAYALSSEIRGRWSILTLILLSSLAPLIINFVGAMLTATLTMWCHDTDCRLIWVIGQSWETLMGVSSMTLCLQLY